MHVGLVLDVEHPRRFEEAMQHQVAHAVCLLAEQGVRFVTLYDSRGAWHVRRGPRCGSSTPLIIMMTPMFVAAHHAGVAKDGSARLLSALHAVALQRRRDALPAWDHGFQLLKPTASLERDAGSEAPASSDSGVGIQLLSAADGRPALVAAVRSFARAVRDGAAAPDALELQALQLGSSAPDPDLLLLSGPPDFVALHGFPPLLTKAAELM